MFTKNTFSYLATEIFKSKTGMSPELINENFHFLEKPYNFRSNYTLEKRWHHTIYQSSTSISFLTQKLWDFYQILRLSKQKLILRTLSIDLAEYVRNMLREWDSFKSFHRFCTFGFVIILYLDHLHDIFLSCASFGDILSRYQSFCILFNYLKFSILHIHE